MEQRWINYVAVVAPDGGLYGDNMSIAWRNKKFVRNNRCIALKTYFFFIDLQKPPVRR